MSAQPASTKRARVNGHNFPTAVREQVLQEFNDASLWEGKNAKQREEILNAKHKLGRGTLQYWVRKQTGWAQPQSKKKKSHATKSSGAIVVARQAQPARQARVVTHAVNEEHSTALLLLKAVQRNLNAKRPSELSADELTTLLALRNLEGKGRST